MKIKKMVFDRDKSILVLGMPESGKTTFYKQLLGVALPLVEDQTDKDEVESFSFKHKSGKEVTIKAGEDFGGTERLFLKASEKLEKTDYTFFIFNINEYLLDSGYRLQCNARFDYIYRKKNNKDIYCLASHIDLIRDNPAPRIKQILGSRLDSKTYDRLVREKIYDILKMKEYISIQEKLSLINLQDKAEVQKFIQNIDLI